jgi:adenylate cyclase
MSTPVKILVVDDLPQNVKLLADLLSVKGYAVTTAASGEEALHKVGGEQPDLVLLDVVMPGMSGYEVCRALRANPAMGRDAHMAAKLNCSASLRGENYA